MDISGKLSLHLPIQTGEGKNGPWQKSGFVVEISNEKFPKKVFFTTWGDAIAKSQNFQAGDDVKVSFDLESREYQGKWYSDIKAWNIERIAGVTSNTTPPIVPVNAIEPIKPEPFNVTAEDDLPF